MGAEWEQSGREVGAKREQNGSQMGAKWEQNGSKAGANKSLAQCGPKIAEATQGLDLRRNRGDTLSSNVTVRTYHGVVQYTLGYGIAKCHPFNSIAIYEPQLRYNPTLNR